MVTLLIHFKSNLQYIFYCFLNGDEMNPISWYLRSKALVCQMSSIIFRKIKGPFVSVKYFSQTKKCCCKSNGFNDGVKLAIHIWRDEASQYEKSFDFNLPQKMKHWHLLACYIITTSITKQTYFFRFTFHKIHQEKQIFASFLMSLIIIIVTRRLDVMNLRFKLKKLIEHLDTISSLSFSWIQTWCQVNVQMTLYSNYFILDSKRYLNLLCYNMFLVAPHNRACHIPFLCLWIKIN